MSSGPQDAGRPHARAGHEDDRDYVDKDVEQAPGTEREGDYADKDVDDAAPDATREGDYTDKDVTDDDTDTPPSSYVSSDVPR
jgi:hypothetical protein